MQGAFGLAVLAVGGAVGAVLSPQTSRQDSHFITPEVDDPQHKEGPVMMAGIELVAQDDGVVRGMSGDIHLFDVDEMGAQLIRLADGSRTLDDLADSLELPVNPADVASFFVALGQAGYLSNTVLVNLLEVPA